VCGKFGSQSDECRAHDGEVGVEVPVFGTGFVLAPEGVTHPVVADLATSPMSPDEAGESFGATRQSAAEIIGEGSLGIFGGGFCGRGLVDNDQAASVREADFEWFYGEDPDAPSFQASVAYVRVSAGKRGASLSAVSSALCSA
jgi:hypothetical protein